MATDDMGEGRRHRRRVILASCVGSALEWYDFFIYSSAAALVFGRLFFTNLDPAVGTLVALATFGVGFLSRPLGGIVFGHLGDRLGRKPILVATLLIVGIGTALIGMLPTYETIGIWAPILLVCLRLVQGFGAGAEYGGAVIMLVENAPPHRRGFWGSFAPLGVGVGMMLASATFALVSMMPEAAFLQWGWRIPFLLSLVMVAFGLVVRARLSETPVFEKAVLSQNAKSRMPVLDAIRRQPRSFLVVLGARLAENGHGYLFPVFGLSYAVNQLGLPKSEVLVAMMAGYVLQILGVMGFSILSDKIGRRPVYIFGALFSAAIAFPFFSLLDTGSFIWIFVAFALTIGIGNAAMFGTQAAYFAELFGPSRRFSGFAFARELGSIIAGGPAPAVSAALVAWASGAAWPVAIYAIVLGLLTAIAVWSGPETYRDDITADDTEPSPLGRVALRPA